MLAKGEDSPKEGASVDLERSFPQGHLGPSTLLVSCMKLFAGRPQESAPA